MSKKTQAERAQSYFELHSKVVELFGTSDGFNFEKPQDALSHSTTLVDKEIKVFKAKGETGTLEQPEALGDQPEFLKMSVKNMTEALPEIKDVDALIGYLEYERLTENPRSTAIKAIEDRLEALAEGK